jgi:hypothetical protein
LREDLRRACMQPWALARAIRALGQSAVRRRALRAPRGCWWPAQLRPRPSISSAHRRSSRA